MSTIDHDVLTHLIEYPADSGRFYHRRDDGSVLRVETFLDDDSWFDITCDVVEITMSWGDTTGTDLTPTSDTGTATIVLRDNDGRYGPIPPGGFPLHQRWRPVRIWVGYVADPDDMPTDLDTDYGEPGDYGSTPPELYGGHLRTRSRDGITLRFSGWIIAQERNPLEDLTTTWTLADGMVRLVDQSLIDYDGKADTEMPEGVRDGAPGNYRVSTLISQVHSPSGDMYSTVVDTTPTHAMMRSPEGKIGDLVRAVATSDLAFFWWQPNVAPADHDVFADYYEYRTIATMIDRGLEWFLDCDHAHVASIDEVSDDTNFYSAVRAAKGIIKREVPIPQPPFSGAAFDTAYRKVAFQQWKVQPGETITLRLECSPRVDKLSFQCKMRMVTHSLDWTDCGQQSMTFDPTTDKQSITSKPFVVDATVDDDTLLEVLVEGKALASLHSPGFLAENVTLFVVRANGTGPEALVDDPTLADDLEVHEYERKDLMLRYQTDVSDWANWIVNRSNETRYSLTNVGQLPELGSPAWSWAMWHGARLGDTVTIAMHDGSNPTVSQWLRGVEFHVPADGPLSMSLQLEPITTPPDELDFGPRMLTLTAQPLPSGSVPFPGGAFLPVYRSDRELPDWSYLNSGAALKITDSGALSWTAGDDLFPLRTAEEPAQRVELTHWWPNEIRFYQSGAPSEVWGYPNDSARIANNIDSLDLYPPSFDFGGGLDNFGQLGLTADNIFAETDTDFSDTDPDYPGDSSEGWFQLANDQFSGSVELYAYGPSGMLAGVTGTWDRTPSAETLIQTKGADGHETQVGAKPQLLPVLLDSTAGSLVPLIGVDTGDPATTQYVRQMGRTAVSFTAGVGTITVPVAMGTLRVPHCQIVGTTVGGDMVAQVDTPTDTTIVVYLAAATTGTLTVAWSVEHDFVWPTLMLAPDRLDSATHTTVPSRRGAGALGADLSPAPVFGGRFGPASSVPGRRRGRRAR